MPPEEELEAAAKAIIDGNRYMTLGTADQTGRPWVSPVWYAPDGYREFFWASYPDARHSRNIAARPEIAIVIFDSRAAVGSGQGVYMSAIAEQVSDAELERRMGIFSLRSVLQGDRPWTQADVQPPASLRLYCANVSEQFVLDTVDRRIPISLE